MSLAERRWLRLFTLCALYVAQGIPWGFMATTLPAYLTKRGVDFGIVTAALSFTTLPYAFKWVWGPIIDSFTLPFIGTRFGRRRPWIVLAQGLMALTVIALIALDLSTQIKLLAWMIFIHTIFNALQDVAVDALAVDLLPDNERGKANGLMYGSKYGGGAIGGIGMATIISMYGLDTALIVQTSILLAIMMVPLLVSERSGPPPERVPIGDLFRSLTQAFSLRSTIVAALLMLGMNFATGVLGATSIKLFVGELSWDYDEYAAISGGWGLAVGCTGAAFAGALIDRFGRRPVAAAASCALAAGWFVFALGRSDWGEASLLHGIDFFKIAFYWPELAVEKGYWGDPAIIYAIVLFQTACQAIMSVALITMCMDLSWSRVGGSQFTAYMALSNFSTTLGYQFAARANETWDYQGIYWLAAAAQIAVTMLLLPIDPTQVRRTLPLPEGTKINRLGIIGLGALLVFLIGMTIYVTLGTLG